MCGDDNLEETVDSELLFVGTEEYDMEDTRRRRNTVKSIVGN